MRTAHAAERLPRVPVHAHCNLCNSTSIIVLLQQFQCKLLTLIITTTISVQTSNINNYYARARVMLYNAGKFKMSILQLGPGIFGETDQLITYLQGKNLLASNKTCPCGFAMQLSSRSDVSDGVRFRCPDCHKCTTTRDGSFFSKSRLPLQKWVILMY